MRPATRPCRHVRLAILLACAWAAASCAPASAPPAAAPFDRAGVVAVLEAQIAAWNRGDIDAFMDGYWRSDSLTFYSGGDLARGWQAAHDRYVRRYRAEGREMGTLAFELHSVAPLGPDDALVRGAWRLTMKDATPHGLFSLVLHRVPGAGWRIVHDHTSSAS